MPASTKHSFFYVRRDAAGVEIERGRDLASLCINARNAGVHSTVVGIVDPDTGLPPFGFHYSVTRADHAAWIALKASA